MFYTFQNPVSLIDPTDGDGHKLLTLTSIKSLMDLQPFFTQLVRTEGSVSLEKRGMVSSPTGPAMDKFCSLLDIVVENDFIEEIPLTS